MRFDILTLFPEMFSVLNHSIIGKAIDNKILEINLINIRDFSTNKHKKVDDYPYGGGSGMIMQAQPIYDAYKSIAFNPDNKSKVIYLSPSGKTLTQKIAKELSNEKQLILLCGHYEGIDQRVIDEIVDEEISIGDYILTGGELPAMVLIDCISRFIPGVLGNNESTNQESFNEGLLEHPQYTRPPIWNGKSVPDVILSGHHENVKKYNNEQALIKTKKNRPDLLTLTPNPSPTSGEGKLQK